MKARKSRKMLAACLMLSALTITLGAWGYWHFVMAPKYHFVTNATRL